MRIKFEIVYPSSPSKVWKALTDRQALAAWLMENDFEPKLGHRFQFRTKPAPGFDGIVHCEVTAIEEPRLLAYTWSGGGHETVVTWRLEPVEGGTRLQLEHSGFRYLRGFFLSRLLGSGWNRMLKRRLPKVIGRISDEVVLGSLEGLEGVGCHS